MMLFKLSLKNIKKSFKDYCIYFFTLILGVAIFYVFNAIESQTVMLNITSSTRSIIDLMQEMLSGVSIVVSFILGFLIIYASRFLIKRRNKEFGIYMTLGMGKRKISTILLIETILIGIISSIVGLGLGVILSQAMSLLVANMFEADLTRFAFTFSSSACIKTIIYFGITYLIVMIFNTVAISKCKLIDLLHGNRKSEEVKLKNLMLQAIIFIASAVTLGIAYYLVTGGIRFINSADKIMIPILMGIASTFTLFWSASGLILKVCSLAKKTYYRGLNSFVTRQISSKINTTVFSMSIICLMLFVTICVLSSALSIKNSMSANIDTLAPVDIEIIKITSQKEDLNEKENALKKLSARETLARTDIDWNNFKDILEVSVYKTPDLTLEDTLGSTFATAKSTYNMLNYYEGEEIVKIGDYNKVAHLFGKKEYQLDSDEYMIIADFDSWINIRNMALKSSINIELFGKTLRPKYDACQEGFIYIGGSKTNDGIILVPDEVVDDSYKRMDIMYANYNSNDKEGKKKIEASLANLEKDEYTTDLKISTRLSIIEASVGLGGLVTFIGLYLGIIFLISSAAILALKELSESSDNKVRFQMLRRLGADEAMLNRALMHQIAIFFAFPLLVAIIHSIFGIMFCNYILETFGNKGLLLSIAMTATLIVLIYGGYFYITYATSKNIIRER